MKVPVSILVPVRNEEGNLPLCLGSVQWADEIIVVDSQSVDRTVEIAREFGARTVQFHFKGTWPKKKNWALENVEFRNEWVFILDADECLPSEAQAEFNQIVSSPASADGYWINRRFMFLGRWLKHAYYPNWNLRLFRHRLGRFEKLTDLATASGDNEVHEHVVVKGRTARLKSEMDHFAFPTVDTFIEKHNRYSNWEARVAVLGKGGGQLQHRGVGWKRWLRRASQHLPFRPFLRFLYVYIWQRGFLDGREGFYFARLHALYEFLIVAKSVELRLARKRNPDVCVGGDLHGG